MGGITSACHMVEQLEERRSIRASTAAIPADLARTAEKGKSGRDRVAPVRYLPARPGQLRQASQAGIESCQYHTKIFFSTAEDKMKVIFLKTCFGWVFKVYIC